MKERYQNMMEQISLDETAKALMLERVTAGEKRRHRVPLRTALVAACVCLVLVGGALAGSLSGVWMTDVESSREQSSFRVQAEMGEWRTDEMGERLRADLENDALVRVFDDRESLEDYMGVSFIHSPLLEGAGIVEDLEVSIEYGWNVRPELIPNPDARYVLTGTTVDGEEMSGVPEVLKVTAQRVVENAEVFIDARIITDRADPETVSGGLAGETFDSHPELWVEYICDEDGNPLEDENGEYLTRIDYYTTAEKAFEADEYEMANGLTAVIITASDVLLDGSNSFREYFGYFISDGILYTVYPYAIYDPALSFPMHDSDMLIVLETVLDSFE